MKECREKISIQSIYIYVIYMPKGKVSQDVLTFSFFMNQLPRPFPSCLLCFQKYYSSINDTGDLYCTVFATRFKNSKDENLILIQYYRTGAELANWRTFLCDCHFHWKNIFVISSSLLCSKRNNSFRMLLTLADLVRMHCISQNLCKYRREAGIRAQIY